MKTKQISASLLLVFAILFSCDKLDELTEFDVNEDFTTTVNVSISDESSEPQNFTESANINIATNQDIQDNLDLIEDIDVNTITYEITNYTGGEGITVTNTTLNFSTISISIEDIELQEADINNTVYNVNNTQQFNSIGNLFENSSSINATVSGTISGSPVSFDVIITVDLTVTIDGA